MKNCNCDSDINRDGSGQLQRYLKALDPSYAPIDGRGMEQMLAFAKKYAAEIRFYDIPGSMPGDSTDPKKISWEEFFRRDMATVIAAVALTDLEFFKKKFVNASNELAAYTDTAHFADLFKPILEMLKKIDHWYSIAIPENPLFKDLVLAIDSDLRLQAKQIMAYKKEFNVVDPNTPLPINFDGLENADLWGIYQPIDVNGNLYEGSNPPEKIKYAALYVEDIFYSFYNALTQFKSSSAKYFDYAIQEYPGHQPHMALFISFLELFSIARGQMNGLTDRMLDFYYKEVLHLGAKNSIPDRAHIVFELAKEVASYDLTAGSELNGGKDVEGKDQFYKAAGELVVNQAKVKELSTLYIEKDSPAYLDVKRIRNIHARKNANSKDGSGEEFSNTNPKWPTFGNIGDRDRGNSICDAIAPGEVLTDLRGRMGVAISSPQLLMQGGKRLVQIEIQNSSEKAASAEQHNLFDQLILALSGFEIWLSGEKGWIKIGGNQAGFSDKQKLFIGQFKKVKETVYPPNSEPDSFYFIDEQQRINIYLSMSEQGVLAFNPKIHDEYLFETFYPVLLLLNRPNENLNIPEDVFTKIEALRFSVRTKVGSILPDPDSPEFKDAVALLNSAEGNFEYDGLRKLVLQNELRVLPEGASFDPFTSLPESGKPFYIGSSEVFNRPLDKMAVFVKKAKDIQKKSVPTDGLFLNTFKVTGSGIASATSRLPEDYSVHVRTRRKWLELCDIQGLDFSRFDLVFNILRRQAKTEAGVSSSKPTRLERGSLVDVVEWKEGMETGFLRFDNLVVIPEDEKDHLLRSQNAAHILEIKEVAVSYDSTLQLQKGVDMLYHVYPFGVTEINIAEETSSISKGEDLKEVVVVGYATDGKKYPLAVNNNRKLLPQFTRIEPYEEINDQQKENGNDSAKNKIVSQERLKKSTQYSGVLQQEGMLFIGLENAQPLQNVSMLFQFAEGSAGDEDNPSPAIAWSYLAYNKWQPLNPEDLISDGTYGFQTTGIINISIPSDANAIHTIMTDGLTWLCASVSEHSERIPMLVDIVTQAVEVQFDDRQNAIAHFDNALVAGSINKLSSPMSEITAVKQPFASFDGKQREIGKEFYTRVSERLRHKQRAITPWDYEHLVLDRFPSIYKVKCLTHTDSECLCRAPLKIPVIRIPADAIIMEVNLAFADDNTFEQLQTKLKPLVEDYLGKDNLTKMVMLTAYYDYSRPEIQKIYNSLVRICAGVLIFMKIPELDIRIQTINDLQRSELHVQEVNSGKLQPGNEKTCCGPQVSPGHVLMVPVANLKNRNAINPLQPKTSRRTLLEIESYLKKYTSPFVKVHAKNPVYEQILVVFKVKFYSGTDKGFYLKKLNEEIVHFLTPWAFDENAEVAFGQKIYASAIINFIEERKYVDFITDFVMYVCRNECCPPTPVVDVAGEPDKNWLDSIGNCCDMEKLIENDALEGTVIAKPSTARSILVSVPQHHITSYVEPPQLIPCEKFARSKASVLKLVAITRLGLAVNIVTADKTVAIIAAKNMDGTGSTKPGPATNAQDVKTPTAKTVKKLTKKDAAAKDKSK